jgi:nicotinate-nucleotide adenylyltransferase
MFDPIHNGHLNCAEQALDRFDLGKVFFIPSALPPHKKKAYASGEVRFEMAEIAVADNPAFEVSRAELDRDAGMSYTVDTVKEFRERCGDEIYFIIGADAFSEISSWRSPEELFMNCNFIVMGRPGWSMESTIGKIGKGMGRGESSPFFKILEEGVSYFVIGSSYRVFFYAAKELDISSSLARERIMKGEPVADILPEDVAKYIKKKGLYV